MPKAYVIVSLLSVVLFGSSVTIADSQEDDCEAMVDMADSLNFHKMHMECGEKEVKLFEAPEEKSLVDTDKEGADAVAEKSAAEVNSSNTASVETKLSGKSGRGNRNVHYTTREPFTATGGAQSAINGLFTQMMQQCPDGWTKLDEWAQPEDSVYYLYYRFECR